MAAPLRDGGRAARAKTKSLVGLRTNVLKSIFSHPQRLTDPDSLTHSHLQRQQTAHDERLRLLRAGRRISSPAPRIPLPSRAVRGPLSNDRAHFVNGAPHQARDCGAQPRREAPLTTALPLDGARRAPPPAVRIGRASLSALEADLRVACDAACDAAAHRRCHPGRVRDARRLFNARPVLRDDLDLVDLVDLVGDLVAQSAVAEARADARATRAARAARAAGGLPASLPIIHRLSASLPLIHSRLAAPLPLIHSRLADLAPRGDRDGSRRAGGRRRTQPAAEAHPRGASAEEDEHTRCEGGEANAQADGEG